MTLLQYLTAAGLSTCVKAKHKKQAHRAGGTEGGRTRCSGCLPLAWLVAADVSADEMSDSSGATMP
jgi:hypothetical protein